MIQADKAFKKYENKGMWMEHCTPKTAFDFGYLAALSHVVKIVTDIREEGIPLEERTAEFLERMQKLYQ